MPPVSEFNYTFKIVADEKYGKKNQETGEWNGMMGELLAQVRKVCMPPPAVGTLINVWSLQFGGYGATPHS